MFISEQKTYPLLNLAAETVKLSVQILAVNLGLGKVAEA